MLRGTSVLLGLYVNDTRSEDVSRCYSKCNHKLVASLWGGTEFAGALGVKQRTG